MQSKYTNITIFMSLIDFVRPNVYDCYWTILFSLFCSCLPTTACKIQRQTKGRRAHILEKGPGTLLRRGSPTVQAKTFALGLRSIMLGVGQRASAEESGAQVRSSRSYLVNISFIHYTTSKLEPQSSKVIRQGRIGTYYFVVRCLSQHLF